MKTRLLFPSLFLSNFTVRPALNTLRTIAITIRVKTSEHAGWSEPRDTRVHARAVLLYFTPRGNPGIICANEPQLFKGLHT